MRDLTDGMIAEPRFVQGDELLLAGVCKGYSFKDFDKAARGIPAQWQSFGSWIGRIPGEIGAVGYGVCFDQQPDDGFKYLCGVQVADPVALPDTMTHITLPPRKYAVFLHRGHVSRLRGTLDTVHSQLPKYDLRPAPKTNFFFERYGEEYNPQAGIGGIEIWIPINI